MLLDTCVLLWFLYNDPALPDKLAEKIEKSRDVYLSIASLWEIAIKKTIHKLDIPETVQDLEAKCREKHIFILPIKIEYLKIRQYPQVRQIW